jgi:hypothetical protein
MSSTDVVVFGDSSTSDVVFIVGATQTRVLAHRAPLSAASVSFARMFTTAAMLYHSASSGGATMQLEIAIDTCDVVVFRELLHWVYHGACSVPLKSLRVADLWALLEMSTAYQLDGLSKALEQAVGDLLSVKTCCALWLLAVDIQNERLALRCEQFFVAHADEIQQSRFYDVRVLMLLPRSRSRQSSIDADAGAWLSVQPPPPLPVPDVQSLASPSTTTAAAGNLMLSSLAERRRSSDVLRVLESHDSMTSVSPYGSNDSNELLDLFDASMSALSEDQLALFPGLPQSMTPFNAMPTAFASLGDALTQPTVLPAVPAVAHDNTLRTGPSIAARMPLLQGTVWWQTVDQLRVMLESLRLVVHADIATLFLYDDVTDELYARILTHDGSLCEIAVPASVGLVGAAFTTRSTINTPSPYDDPRFYRGIDEKLGSRTRAIIATPIMTSLSTRPIGVLEVLNAVSTAPFTDANVREVELVSRMAAKLVEIAVDRVKATVATHIDAINTQIDTANAVASEATVVPPDVGAASAAVAPASASAAISAKRRISVEKPSEPRRTSDPLKRGTLGPSDIFLQSGPLQMFDEDSLFPDPANRSKRMRPAAPVLHLRPASRRDSND